MSELLTTNLWSTAVKLAKKAKHRQAAIAYVTSDRIKFGKGDLLIVDASEDTIKSGGTAAPVLRQAFRRGAVVCSHPNLHAKVLVLDRAAIIGSANLSDTSANDLEECAVLTQEPALLWKTRAFLQQLRELSTVLTGKELNALCALPVVPRKPKRATVKRTKAQAGRHWIIGITEIKDGGMSKDDEATVQRGEDRALEELKLHRRHLDWVRVRGNSGMRQHAQAGDRMIRAEAATIKSRNLEICAPVTIQSREDGEDSTFFYFDKRESSHRPELTKLEFVNILKEAGSSLKSTPRMVRELSGKLLYALDDLWPKKCRKA
ncbi:phospholipase D family protein [Brevifollis gellanilyticus]|uniref:PLD phosphodiesterase domain-containing protein n=1 Tax=Brevifollis gellanilyticus TaxID=748831 RepID=A0A512MGK4_9BACT|nr:phospholipase D family protein [Brevifollis gellanilyticus]GEP45870.1 hypothetical protein BGE01nite_51610 [Brevifollis gellanilyticus]